MSESRVHDRQTKGEQKRKHLLETALTLFAQKGYTATTMRDIATAAHTALGLTYHYFPQKEALVLALYQQIASDLVVQTATLPTAPVADRFLTTMRTKFALLTPYEAAFGALVGAALTPNSGIAVLGHETMEIRDTMLEVFRQVVRAATDAPRSQQGEDLAIILYVLHLALIVVWLHDHSPARRTTALFLDLCHDTLRHLRWFLRLPPVAHLLARLAEALQPLIVGPA